MKPLLAPTALLGCLGLLLPGCVTTRTQASAKLKDANERAVANCTYLGDVSGSSGVSVLGMATDTSVENARNDAAEKAAAMGATHVVWGLFQSGQKTTIQGRAYKCPEGAKQDREKDVTGGYGSTNWASHTKAHTVSEGFGLEKKAVREKEKRPVKGAKFLIE